MMAAPSALTLATLFLAFGGWVVSGSARVRSAPGPLP